MNYDTPVTTREVLSAAFYVVFAVCASSDNHFGAVCSLGFSLWTAFAPNTDSEEKRG